MWFILHYGRQRRVIIVLRMGRAEINEKTLGDLIYKLWLCGLEAFTKTCYIQ